MSTDKTKTLGREFISVEKLHANPLNPNEMSEAQFNLLSDNIEKMGITDPILVRPHPELEGEYRIIGGMHRWEVAKLHGYTEVPCTVVNDPDFTDDEEAFQIVRHNIIGGKMDPTKFAKLVDSLSQKYGDGIAADMFGFVDEGDFQKLLKKTQKSLPKELQVTFKEASKELKTIDDLAKLLNALFANHGDTLDHGYMIFDYGGKESVWLRMQVNQLKHFRELSTQVAAKGKALDHLFAAVVKTMVEDPDMLQSLLDGTPDVAQKADAAYASLEFLD